MCACCCINHLTLSDFGCMLSITDTFTVFLFTATKPKLSELRSLKCRDGTKIEIITSIALTWKDFGVLLEFDDDGRKLDLIEANQRVNGPAACCTEMFQTWLKGAGRQPASWDIVIELLEDCEQTYLYSTVGQSSTVGWAGGEDYVYIFFLKVL